MSQVGVIDLHLTACENVPRPSHPTHTMWIITGRREYRGLVPRKCLWDTWSTTSSPLCAALWLDKGKISKFLWPPNQCGHSVLWRQTPSAVRGRLISMTAETAAAKSWVLPTWHAHFPKGTHRTCKADKAPILAFVLQAYWHIQHFFLPKAFLHTLSLQAL